MNSNDIIKQLREAYPQEETRIKRIEELLEKINTETNDKEVLTKNIEELQQVNNELFSTYSDENLIELQIIINEYRHKYDITDPREIINWDNGKGFVQ